MQRILYNLQGLAFSFAFVSLTDADPVKLNQKMAFFGFERVFFCFQYQFVLEPEFENFLLMLSIKMQ